MTVHNSYSSKARSPWLAGFLSLFLPGLGHLYVGRWRRGLLAFGALMAVQSLTLSPMWFLPAKFIPFALTLAATAIATIVVVAWIVMDASRIARRDPDYRLQPLNRWFVYLGAAILIYIIPILLFGTAKKHAPIQLFDTASNSMEETLRRGDKFLVDLSWYSGHAPRAGDVAVYRVPSDPRRDYVKRIIAVGGDRVSIRQGRAVINDVSLEEPYAKVGAPESALNNTTEYRVPNGSVFVLGDNRSNSIDSRVASHGSVPLPNLVGRATDIVFSTEIGRIGRWVGSASATAGDN